MKQADLWNCTDTLSREGVCVACYPWIPPVGQILLLVPRFDREFVMTFQRHSLVGGKMAPDLKLTLFSTKACVSIKELLRKWAAQEGPHIILFAVWWGRCFKQILARFTKCSSQMTGQISLKFDLKFPIIQWCTWTSRWEINRSKRRLEALRFLDNTAKHTR